MQEREEKRWYQSPWFWGVGGCCAGCLILPLAFVAIVGVGTLAVFRNLDVHQEALARLRADPRAVAALGEPIEAGWLPQGNIETSGSSGEADFAISVSGPQGSGTLYVEAEKRAGQWTYRLLILEVEGGERMDLLAGEVLEDPSR